MGFALIAVALAMSPALLGAQRQPARPTEVLPGPTTTWSLAVVGDAIITRRVAQFDNPADPRFQDMVKVIRGADAAMVNLEISLLRLSGFKGWPEVENDGNWELGPPEAAHDLKQLGFDLYNRANNHATDYGVEGMRSTDALLDELGLVHAGSGLNLGARAGQVTSTRRRAASPFRPM